MTVNKVARLKLILINLFVPTQRTLRGARHGRNVSDFRPGTKV